MVGVITGFASATEMVVVGRGGGGRLGGRLVTTIISQLCNLSKNLGASTLPVRRETAASAKEIALT